jgi:hypothetical protein
MSKEIAPQSEKEELRERLRHWQTLSIEQRLQWLESAMRFSNDAVIHSKRS